MMAHPLLPCPVSLNEQEQAMADRNEQRSDDTGRKGFGDDQGTRVGSPTPGRDASLSGSMGEGEQHRGGQSTGAGAEATEGEHSRGKRDQADKSALEDVDTGRSRPDEATTDRSGSEPLGREREHQSGYGGAGGAPKTSSDNREPLEPGGRADAR